MDLLIIGIVTAFNLLVILKKVTVKRYQDAILDTGLFITVTVLFSGSYAGMVVAMIASLIISIYLYANPPTFFHNAVENKNSNLSKIWDEIRNFDPSRNPRSK